MTAYTVNNRFSSIREQQGLRRAHTPTWAGQLVGVLARILYGLNHHSQILPPPAPVTMRCNQSEQRPQTGSVDRPETPPLPLGSSHLELVASLFSTHRDIYISGITLTLSAGA